MAPLDDLRNGFKKFREKKYAIYVGLALAFVVSTLLLIYAAYLLCFGVLLVALAGYYIPYFFGMRSKKQLAVWGLVLILLLSIPYTVTIVNNQLSSETQTISTTDGRMINGKVTPFTGDQNTVYNYSVLVTDPGLSDVRVIILDTWAGTQELNTTMTGQPAAGGTLYTFETTLQNRTEWGYYFIAFDGERFIATSTSNYGPIMVSQTDMFVHWLPFMVLSLFIQVGLLYFLLLALGYWTDRSRAKLAEAKKQQQQPNVTLPPAPGTEEKFVCSECGAEVPVGAEQCAQCGERFDDSEEPTKPPAEKGKMECSDCGATVDEDAQSCWNCGKEFED